MDEKAAQSEIIINMFSDIDCDRINFSNSTSALHQQLLIQLHVGKQLLRLEWFCVNHSSHMVELPTVFSSFALVTFYSNQVFFLLWIHSEFWQSIIVKLIVAPIGKIKSINWLNWLA